MAKVLRPSFDEHKRLEALKRYAIVDTGPEKSFDDLAELAAHICGTPVSLVNFIDSERQWFKAKVGWRQSQAPREFAFCEYTIRKPYQLCISEDTTKDSRFAENPYVVGNPAIRFYAGAPLATPGGVAVGTLCVIDFVPRQINEHQRRALTVLARQVMLQLELRLNLRLREEAERAVAKRDEFLSIASHELRTPLTPLRVQFGLVKKLAGGDEKTLNRNAPALLRSLAITDQQIQQLYRLVNDLFDVSRLNLGKLPIRPEKMDLASLVQTLTSRLSTNPGFKSKIILVQPEEPVWGNFDPSRMEQLISILLDNAVKYGLDRPIEVTLEARDEKARLIVADHGIGIPETDRDNIFSLFTRGKDTGKFGGMGIGLSIARQIVLGHGGSIRVESGENGGSRFIVELPLPRPAAKAA